VIPCDVLDVEQRTPAWFAARCGKLTGTGAAAMVASIRSGEAAARRDLRTDLVIERLTGISRDQFSYKSAEMQWGIDHEADARRAYEARTGAVVQAVGFLAHPELPAGCSPDGLIRDVGVLEIKCPKSATHLDTLRSHRVPAIYLPQVRHALWLTGADWCDFVSFDPRFPRPLQLVILRSTLDAGDRAAWELIVRTFLGEVERELREVEQLLSQVSQGDEERTPVNAVSR
jgi:YqaJ-like viral recombinase domain